MVGWPPINTCCCCGEVDIVTYVNTTPSKRRDDAEAAERCYKHVDDRRSRMAEE